MSHCPDCSEPTPDGARACPFCGVMLASRAAPPGSRTIVGGASLAAAPEAPVARANRTIVGMPPQKAARAAQPGAVAPPAAPDPPAVGAATALHGSPARVVPSRAGSTLVGVARPGAAAIVDRALERRPPAPREPDPPNYAPARELGATIGADALGNLRPPPGWDDAARKKQQKRRRGADLGAVVRQRSPMAAPRAGEEPISRRGLAVVVASGALALVAVLVAVFWPSPPPLTARPRADSGGREGVELTCKSCPDGTKITIAGASADMTGGVALVPLKTALSVGDNRFRAAIDRPGNGRDETIGVSVHVAYRIRPDLASLQAEQPAFQIVAEAATGTVVTIDGKKLPLAAGRGVFSIDVTDVCTGLANDVKTLARQIPYVVTPSWGPMEQGVVNVSVGVVPLHLDAPVAILPPGGERSAAIPEPHVVTDGPSFVLAGWTMKGAEVLAAGRPITVHADGSFAQVMNVSSVGATQIEVRARMPGMAPRLTRIRVRRVESIEKAAREIEADPKIGYRDLAADIAGSIGKAVMLSGEVVETKKQGYQTVMLLDVAAASGCAGGGCTVRLVQGSENAAKRGDGLRVYGHVARAFSVPGRPDIAEIEVDFTQRAGAGAGDRK